MNFIILIYNGKNSSQSMIRDIYLYDKLNIKDLVYKNCVRVKDDGLGLFYFYFHLILFSYFELRVKVWYDVITVTIT